MTHRVPLAAALAIALLPCVAAAQSGALGVAAKRVLVRNAVPDDESRNKVVVVARDAAIAVPDPGSVYDPRCPGDGGSVVVAGPGIHQDFLLCSNWTLLGSETSPKGYRYRDARLDDGAVRTIIWKPGLLKMLLSGRGPTTTLFVHLTPGSPQLMVEVTLLKFLNDGNGYCVNCPPVDGRDGSDGKIFLGQDCPAPTVCFSSASGAFLD